MKNEQAERPPFFIVGCGRSGTTLLRAMLNAHPEIAIPLESLFIVDYLLSGQSIETLKKNLVREYELKEWGIKITREMISQCATAAQVIEKIHLIYANTCGKHRWGQKTPRLVRYGDLVKRNFPAALFIHLIRDPRAVVCSLKNSEVHRSSVFHGAKRWHLDINHGLDLEEKYPDDVIRIYYEDLVSDPYSALVEICRFLGIEFSGSMLQFYRQAPAEYGPYYSQIHAGLSSPVTSESTEKWRRELSEREGALLEEMLGKEMSMLNYRRAYDRAANKHNTAFKWYSGAVRLVRLPAQLSHYRKYRPGYLPCVLRRKFALKTFGAFPVNR